MPKTKTTTKKSTKKTTKKKVVKPYTLKITFNDEVFETEAVSLLDALVEFVGSPVFTTNIKTKVVINYSNDHGQTERTLLYSLPRARRVFKMSSVKDTSIEVLANQLMLAFA